MPMIIDSAASYVTVRPDVFHQLGIAPIRKTPIVTASQRAEAPIGQVDKITVGSRCSAVNVQVISISFPEDLPAGRSVGRILLQNFLVSMDYDKGKLELITK